jgi:hypothetical protein
MNRYTKISLMLGILVAVAFLAVFWATTYMPIFATRFTPFGPRLPPPGEIRGDIELFYTIHTVVTSLNITLLIFLIFTYVDIYRKTRSAFTIALLIFATVLFLNALSSNPVIQRIFGFYAFGLGPFAMLPALFTFFALSILLYITLR